MLGILLLLVLVTAPAMAYETPINFKAIKPDGKVASNADYKIYYTNGSLAVSGVLDADGEASFNLTDNATYIALIVTSAESILDDFSVPTITDPVNQTPVNITINATTLYALNVSSALARSIWGVSAPSVSVELVPENYTKFNYTFSTNWTVYTMLRNNLTFPNETKSGIWTFVLENITVDGSVYTNVTTVTIPMTDDTNVVAYYELKYPVLEPIYLIIIAGLIGLALIAVVIVSGKKAKATVRAKVEDSFRFYKRIK
ncbi:MAG: hypothetical protein DRG69_07690 [Deltaproteobacteria bacterium]|nr:MAG: hypothetical protein DRG69_07690 [Deltaproteobacteria bacterium]